MYIDVKFCVESISDKMYAWELLQTFQIARQRARRPPGPRWAQVNALVRRGLKSNYTEYLLKVGGKLLKFPPYFVFVDKSSQSDFERI